MSSFSDFNLPETLLNTLKAMAYETPTPVQAKSIPILLEGRDLLATAQTGTGKTAAFGIPLLAKMMRGDKKGRRPSLIVAPTRELAEQIGKMLQQLTQKTPQFRICVVIGGTSFSRQIRMLRSRPAFVVGTPGRLIDQVREGNLDLKPFGSLVIDEADRLLDMGFEPQMNEIVANLPGDRQTMLFSATLAPEIQKLALRYMKTPQRVAIGEVAKPVDKIKQDVVRVRAGDKPEALVSEIDKVAGSMIVFVRTKQRAERLAYLLDEAGHKVARIHGDRSQSQRSRAIEDFRSGRVRILVATDIAARGLDVPHIQHVVNFDLPLSPEDYVHRIGRTARAGAEGHSLAFVTPEEELLWAKIHKLMYGKYPEKFIRPEREFKSTKPATKTKSAQSPGKKRPPRKKNTGLPFKRENEASAKAGGNRAERRAQQFGRRGKR